MHARLLRFSAGMARRTKIGLCARALSGFARPSTTDCTCCSLVPLLSMNQALHALTVYRGQCPADIRKIVFTNQEMLGFTKISRVRKLVVLQHTKLQKMFATTCDTQKPP